jgi:hypothetical protein
MLASCQKNVGQDHIIKISNKSFENVIHVIYLEVTQIRILILRWFIPHCVVNQQVFLFPSHCQAWSLQELSIKTLTATRHDFYKNRLKILIKVQFIYGYKTDMYLDFIHLHLPINLYFNILFLLIFYDEFCTRVRSHALLPSECY